MAAIYKTEAGGHALIARTRELLAAWPVPSEQLRLPTSQGETFVIASGDPAAPALLLLHGSGSNSLMWLRDVAAWSAHFRVYAIDLIGEPGLSAPSRPPLNSDSYVRWLDDVLTGLSLARADVVGISLGGWMALDFATARPECVGKLVLLCPGGVGRQKMGCLFKAMFLLLFGDWGRRKAMALALGTSETNANPQAAAYMQAIFKVFKPRRDKLPIFSDDRLKRLTMPVLLIAGGRDAMLDSDETLRRLERTVPKLTAIYLLRAGHLLTGQTAAILDFLT